MKTRPLTGFMAAALAAVAILFGAVPASGAAAALREFWVTEAISGRTVGPVVSRPGNKFVAAGRRWVVLESAPGQINFADAETLAAQGPYDLVEMRVFDLGAVACVFSRVAPFSGGDPAADRAIVTQARRVAAAPDAALPERWELSPVPSTNPAAHKEAAPTWRAIRFRPKTDATIFLEPVHRVEYDWKLGGMSGGKKEPLSSTRFGVSGQWNGFSGEIGMASGAKSVGSLVEDSLSISALKIRGGSGFFAAGGWDWALQVADGWSASLGFRALWERVSADVSARTLRTKPSAVVLDENGEEVADSGSLAFASWKSDVDIDEFVLRARADVRYDDWYWGVGLAFAVDCWTDTSSGTDIPVGTTTYRVEADRSQPAALALSGWYTPDDRWVIKGALAIGAETSVRIGAGWLF